MLSWAELTSTERRYVIGAVVNGCHGDLLMPTGRWYRIEARGVVTPESKRHQWVHR